MKIIKKHIAVAIIGLMILMCITGCGKKSESNPISAAFIIGIHSNSPALCFDDNTTNKINKILYNISYTYGSVYYIRCDGKPEIYFSANVTEPSTQNLSTSKLKSIAQNNADSLASSLLTNEALAVVEEVDTLGALQIASDSLNSLDDDMEKHLVIADSGICTCSYLDFTEHPILSIDTKELIGKLEEAKAIPDLKGIELDWYFMGATAGNQKSISEKQKNALKEIWSAILDASGARYIIHTDVISGEEYPDLPDVSAVEAEERTLSIEEYVEKLEDEPDIIAVLMDEYVQFIGDKAAFKDEKVARNSIEEVAELLNDPKNRDMEVLVVGTTANIYGREEDYFDNLSNDRANAVMNVLVECGVEKSRLTAIGLGHDDPWYQYDLDDNNMQIESIAQLNRKCIIVNKMSDIGQECLKINASK